MSKATGKKRRRRARPKEAPVERVEAPVKAPVERAPALQPLSMQRMLAISAAIAACGIYLVSTSESEVGIGLVLIGLVGLMFYIHRYGRLGAEGAPRRRGAAR
jgi:hypothetical protein